MYWADCIMSRPLGRSDCSVPARAAACHRCDWHVHGYENCTSCCGVATADEDGGVEGEPSVESTTNEEEAQVMTTPATMHPSVGDAVQRAVGPVARKYCDVAKPPGAYKF